MNLLSLLFRVDTSQLDAAERKLGDLGNAANKTQDKVGGASGAFDRFKEVGGPVGEVAERVESVSSALGGMSGPAMLAVGSVIALTTAVVAAGAAIISTSLKVADAADALNDLSNRSNIGTERLSLFDAMAKMAGSSVEELVGSAERLGVKLARQSEESGLAQNALKELGVSAKEANGEQKSMLQLQEDIIIAADKMAGSAKAEGAAVALLGTEYYKIKTAVKEAKEQKVEMYDYMARTGAIVTQQLAKDSDELNDNIDKMKLAFTGMANSVASVVIPILNRVVTVLGNISAGAADIIRRYTGGETESEKLQTQLDDLVKRRDAALNTINKIRGTEFEGTAQGAKAIELARTELQLVNEKLLATSRLKRVADEAAFAAQQAATNGAAGEGNKPGSVKPVKSGQDPMDELSKRALFNLKVQDEAEAEAEKRTLREMERERKLTAAINDEMSKRGLFDLKRQDEAEAAADKQAEAYARSAQALRDMLNPMNELQRQIEAINANPLLGDLEKEDAVAAVSERWVAGMEKMKEKMVEMNEAGRLVFGSIENYIVSAVTSGDFSFKALAKSFIEQLFRMFVQAQIIGPMIRALTGTTIGGFLGLTGGTVPSADGNVFPGGIGNRPTAVRRADGGTNTFFERGPEAVVPLVRGSNGQLGVQMTGNQAVAGVTIGSITISVQGGQTNAETAAALKKELLSTMKDVADGRIVESLRPGGLARQ
jgi:hypothetical protein